MSGSALFFAVPTLFCDPDAGSTVLDGEALQPNIEMNASTSTVQSLTGACAYLSKLIYILLYSADSEI